MTHLIYSRTHLFRGIWGASRRLLHTPPDPITLHLIQLFDVHGKYLSASQRAEICKEHGISHDVLGRYMMRARVRMRHGATEGLSDTQKTQLLHLVEQFHVENALHTVPNVVAHLVLKASREMQTEEGSDEGIGAKMQRFLEPICHECTQDEIRMLYTPQIKAHIEQHAASHANVAALCESLAQVLSIPVSRSLYKVVHSEWLRFHRTNVTEEQKSQIHNHIAQADTLSIPQLCAELEALDIGVPRQILNSLVTKEVRQRRRTPLQEEQRNVIRQFVEQQMVCGVSTPSTIAAALQKEMPELGPVYDAVRSHIRRLRREKTELSPSLSQQRCVVRKFVREHLSNKNGHPTPTIVQLCDELEKFVELPREQLLRLVRSEWNRLSRKTLTKQQLAHVREFMRNAESTVDVSTLREELFSQMDPPLPRKVLYDAIVHEMRRIRLSRVQKRAISDAVRLHANQFSTSTAIANHIASSMTSLIPRPLLQYHIEQELVKLHKRRIREQHVEAIRSVVAEKINTEGESLNLVELSTEVADQLHFPRRAVYPVVERLLQQIGRKVYATEEICAAIRVHLEQTSKQENTTVPQICTELSESTLPHIPRVVLRELIREELRKMNKDILK